MSSSEVSWQSAFWCLPTLAMNIMMQPSGRVCAFDPSVRTYLRSSPIVCAFDGVFVLLRFIIYICIGLSPTTAAKRIMLIRREVTEPPKTDDGPSERPPPGGLQDIEQKPFLRIIWFILGAMTQGTKLMACSGLPWTQAWGGFYLGSFFVLELMNVLERRVKEEVEVPEESRLEYWLRIFEKSLGGCAIFLQLAVLAMVDLAGIPTDPKPTRRWKFRGLRLFAHFVPIFIYLPFILSDSDDPLRALKRRVKSLVLSMLLVNIVLVTLNGLNYRFSHMYYLWSFVISIISWLLFFFPKMKEHVLLCAPNGSEYLNVLVFDFFCRISCFSFFWYVWYYDPSKTYKPNWANNLG